MSTIKDIAKSTGYSPATVSRVLNNDSKLSVSNETRDSIYSAAKQLGYKKKRNACKIGHISFLYWVTEKEELEDIYFKAIKLEIEKQAGLQDISITKYQKSDGIDAVDPYTTAFLAIGRFNNAELSKLEAITQNGVFIDTFPDEMSFDAVRPNLPLMIKQMFEYFIKTGNKNIGFFGGSNYSGNLKTKKPDIREITFREVAREYDVLNESNIFIADAMSVKCGYRIALEAMEKLGDRMPTAFCVASDALAIGILQAFNEKGWAIPQRVSFFSINNISVSKYVSPPLTTFNIDIPLLCDTAFGLLQERFNKERNVQKMIMIAGTPVFRKSTM